jgi:CRP/FNR family transcriptional regulator
VAEVTVGVSTEMPQLDISTISQLGDAVRREPRQIVPSSPCRACSVRHAASYVSLTSDDRAHLASVASTRNVDRGQMLFIEGDPAKFLYTLVGGTFQMYKLLQDGRRQITGFLFPGDFLGLADDGVYAYSAEAVTDAALYRYRFEEMEALLARYPEMENRLFTIASHELAEAQEQMLLLGRKTATEKVASFLLAYAERAAQRGEGSDVLFIPMTRHAIADYLGITTETVSRTLTRLRHDGLISSPRNNQIEILDRDALCQISE